MRTILSTLLFAAIATGLSVGVADAKKKMKHAKKEAAAATCTASPLMRDESRMMTCWPMPAQKK